MNKKIIFILFFVLVIINMFIIVRGEMFTSYFNVSYDSRIEEQFSNNNSQWVNIFFKLNNPSDANNILSTFSENEVKNVVRYNITPDEIELSITQKGFNKLLNDSRVKVVYYSYQGNTANPTSFCGDGTCDNKEDCGNCPADCNCFENEECINRKCDIKKNVLSSNSIVLIIIPLCIVFVGVIIYLVKRKILRK